MVVAQAQPDVGHVRGAHGAAPAAVAPPAERAGVADALADVVLAVVVDHQAGGRARVAVDLDLELVGMVASHEHHRGGVGRAAARGLQGQHAVLHLGAGRVEILVVLPVQADAELAQPGLAVVGLQRQRGGDGILDDILAVAPPPAVFVEPHRLQERLAAEVVVAVLVGVVDDIPAAVRRVDERAVAAGPPAVGVVIGVHERVVGRLLPRAVQALAAGDGHEVARGRACGAALGGDEVPPVTDLADLRAFHREPFGEPALGDLPAVPDLLQGTGDGVHAVVGQLDALAAAEEEPLLSVVTHGRAGVDLADVQVDRVAPGTVRRVGRDHPVAAVVDREIDVELVPDLGDVRGPDAAQVGLQGIADGLPVHQVLRVPDHQARVVVERRMGHVVVVTVPHDGRVGIVAPEDGVGVGPVGGLRRGAGARGEQQRRRGQQGQVVSHILLILNNR